MPEKKDDSLEIYAARQRAYAAQANNHDIAPFAVGCFLDILGPLGILLSQAPEFRCLLVPSILATGGGLALNVIGAKVYNRFQRLKNR